MKLAFKPIKSSILGLCILFVGAIYVKAEEKPLSEPNTGKSSYTSKSRDSRIKELGGLLLFDARTETTSVAQFDKQIELVHVSTPTVNPKANHSQIWLNAPDRRVCALFEDGTYGCFGYAISNSTGSITPVITAVNAGSGLSGGGSSGSITLSLSSPIDSSFLSNAILNQNSLQAGSIFNVSSATIDGQSLLALNSGNVGIGSSSPAQKLDITGNLQFSGALMPNSSSGVSGQILQSAGAGAPPVWISSSALSGSYILNQNSLQSGATFFVSSAAINGQTLLALTSGNVGIGTGNPNFGKLLISGASGSNLIWFTDGTNAGKMGSSTNSTFYSNNGLVPNVFSAANDGNIAAYNSGGTYFGTFPWTDPGVGNVVIAGNLGVGNKAPATKLHMSSGVFTIDGTSPGITVGVSTFVVTGGNVGIGSISPAQKLVVAGLIETTSGIKFPDGTIQISSPTAGASGNFINNQDTLQAGATFYVSSGTVKVVQLSTVTAMTSTLYIQAPTTLFGNTSSQGSQTAPVISLASAPLSGFYTDNNHNINVTINGVGRYSLYNEGFDPTSDNTYTLGNQLLSIGWKNLYLGPGTAAAPAVTFSQDQDNGLFYIGGNSYGFSVAGSSVAILSSTIGFQHKGSTTNDDAPSGYVGERVAATASNVSAPSSGNYGDLTSISLTAGDWDITGQFHFGANGATITACEGGISTTSGNSGSGLTAGDNDLYTLPPTAATQTSVTIANWRQSLSATTTIYLKMSVVYSAGTPKLSGRLSARRVR